MVDAQMQFLYESAGRRWYFAEPGRFERPGLYFWDGASNVHVDDALAPVQQQGAEPWGYAIDHYGWGLVKKEVYEDFLAAHGSARAVKLYTGPQVEQQGAHIIDSPETGWPSRIINGKHVPCTHDGRVHPSELAQAQAAEDGLTAAEVDAIFDAHNEAPTMSYRYLVAQAIELAVRMRMPPPGVACMRDGQRCSTYVECAAEGCKHAPSQAQGPCALCETNDAGFACSRRCEEEADASQAQAAEPHVVGVSGHSTWPELHPATQDLVRRFSWALADKLAAAERKYGYSDGWLSPDWMDECRQHLREHIEKGDPRDVAAYCAFLWHHGASTSTPSPEARETAEPVHWRAVLAADQVPQQLNHSLHVVGFRTLKSAEAWAASEKDFKGWNYTIEPLYAAPMSQAEPSTSHEEKGQG